MLEMNDTSMALKLTIKSNRFDPKAWGCLHSLCYMLFTLTQFLPWLMLHFYLFGPQTCSLLFLRYSSSYKAEICKMMHGICVTPPTRVRTSSPNGSRTRDSGAGGGRSNKERQRLQPLASIARAPLLRSGEWGLHTALTGIHPLHSPP